MSKRNSHRFYIWIWAGLILLGIIASIGGSYFLQKEIVKTLDTQEEIRIQQQVENQELQNIPLLRKQYESYEEKKSDIHIVANEGDLVQIVQDIEGYAKEFGLNLSITENEKKEKQKVAASTTDATQNTVDTDTESPFPNTVSLELMVNGQYVSIVRFLQKLETAWYAIDITKMDLSYRIKEDKEQSVVIQRSSNNPFLLEGSAPSNTEQEAVLPQGEVVGVIDVLIYTK